MTAAVVLEPTEGQSRKELNHILGGAIDEVIRDVFGGTVHQALYRHLEERYSVTRDQVPYRVDTLFTTLENVFGFCGSRTIGRAIARRVYTRMGLRFTFLPEYRLQDYLELAEKQLSQQ